MDNINIYCLFIAYLWERAAERHALPDVRSELKKMIALDKTGDGFIYDMFMYKLKEANYGQSDREVENALCMSEILENLGLTAAEIKSNPALYNGLSAALNTYTDPGEAAAD